MEEKTLRIELARENPYGVYYYAELAFPAKEYELQDAREKLRSVGLPDSALFISTLDCPALPELIDVRLDAPTLSELNFFANRLAMLDDGQRIVLTAVAQGFIHPGEDEPVSMKDLINLTYGLDGVPVASNISTDEQLGQLVIESDMNEDVAAIPEQALYLLDKRKIGKLQRESDGGVFVGNRYVVAGEYELPEVYDGEHLPETPPSEQYAFRLLVSETPESEAEWISLPMGEEEIRAFQEAHQRELPYFHCHDLESIVPQITSENFRHMGRFATLNDLAKEIQNFSPDELITFKAALSAEKPQTLNGVWDVASHVSEYELAAMPGDANDFFKDYLKHHLVAGFDRRWLKNLDAVEMRKGLLDRLGAVETDYGILSARGRSLYELVPYEEPQAKELTTQRMTDEKLEVVEVLGQTALFTNGRVTQKELPEGLYCYDLREGESLYFATVEPKVVVNHAGTLITKQPIIFGEEGYIAFDEDSSPNFLGDHMTVQEFADMEVTQNEEEGQQMGGMQL